MSSMRGIDTPVRQRRRRVFKEVANLAYNSTNLKDDMEALPYKIVDYEESEFWESVYRDRAIIRERIRLAMGMSLRPENREHPGHLTQGLEAVSYTHLHSLHQAQCHEMSYMKAVCGGIKTDVEGKMCIRDRHFPAYIFLSTISRADYFLILPPFFKNCNS